RPSTGRRSDRQLATAGHRGRGGEQRSTMPNSGSTQLDGLGVAITGAAGDIGHAMSLELARRGARVTMIDRVSEADAATRIDAVAAIGSCAYHQADVTDRAALEHALRAVDPLDVAIGNAGIVESAPFLEITADQWRRHLDINLTGCFNLGQIGSQVMVQRGRPGLVLFTGSWVGEIPWPEIGAYCVSKAGV